MHDNLKKIIHTTKTSTIIKNKEHKDKRVLKHLHVALLISSYFPTLFILKFKLRKLVIDVFKWTKLSSSLQIKITEAKEIYVYEKILS